MPAAAAGVVFIHLLPTARQQCHSTLPSGPQPKQATVIQRQGVTCQDSLRKGRGYSDTVTAGYTSSSYKLCLLQLLLLGTVLFGWLAEADHLRRHTAIAWVLQHQLTWATARP